MSKFVALHGFGGSVGANGSGALNFNVVGGTTKPSNPSENTIWINTDTEITEWTFSFNEPSSPTEGLVWIYLTINKNGGTFDALDENNIMLNPMSCKQYVDGAWVTKTGQSYINGAWSGWYTFLYNKGDKCTELTGGWEAQKDNSKTTPATPSISYGATTMTASLWNNTTSNFWGGVVRTKNGIDLTGYTKLTCVTVSTESDAYLMIDEVDQTGFEVYKARATLTAGQSTTIDITSINGVWDVMIYIHNAYGGTAKAEVSQIYLE